MKLNPSPGVAIVKEIKEESISGLNTGAQQKRIIKGEIIEMGPDDMNNYGGIVEAKNYGKKGDTIYFLSYYQEGGYDKFKIDGTEYYLVKFGDFRVNLGGKK